MAIKISKKIAPPAQFYRKSGRFDIKVASGSLVCVCLLQPHRVAAWCAGRFGRVHPSPGGAPCRVFDEAVKVLYFSVLNGVRKIIKFFCNFYCYFFHKSESFSTFVPSELGFSGRRGGVPREATIPGGR